MTLNSSNIVRSSEGYKKILIDNPICNRRFHLVYEEGAPEEQSVKVKCPVCHAVIFEENDHPIVMLAREENLVKSPDGSVKLMPECKMRLS